MEAKNISRKMILTVLVLATVISIAVFALPSASAGGVTSTPDNENVISGQTFLLRHELYFDQPGYGGYFAMAIYWDALSSDENFILENIPSVYWISGPENGSPVENVKYDNLYVNIGESTPPTDGWEVWVKIPAENKVWIDGHFNVDIWLRASSGDGTLHHLDNQLLSYGAGTIMVTEQSLVMTSVDPVTVSVNPALNAVEVSISPENLNGLRGRTLDYAVTVKNTGSHMDNFMLDNHDDQGWQMNLVPGRFDNVPENASRTTTLQVTIPDNATPGTKDNIRIRAISMENSAVSAENICTARLALVTFTVSISPSNENKALGTNATYTFTVVNTTSDNLDFKDNYDLTISDNSGWSLSLPENRIENVGRGEENSENFTVTIPDNALLDAMANITVVATSQADNTVSENANCIAQAKYRVSVSISPSHKEGARGENLTYNVTVQNWGDNVDNYTLSENDDAIPSWGPTLNDNQFLNVGPGESRTTVLMVPVSWYSPPGTLDNIKVRAALVENENIWAGNSCSAYSILLVKQVYQTDDAFVSGNAPDNNYGGDFLYVGRRGNLPVRSFLKFDLSVIPGGSTIENASLNLTTRVNDGTTGGVFGGGENVQCHPVDNDNWSQGTITWNNAPWPSVGNTLDTKSVTQDFTLYSWEVTNFVTGELGGNNEVSFSMIGAGENTSPDHWARFYSKESGPSVSYLLVSYAPGPHSMVVSISPNQIIGRDNVSYSVTVQNVGFVNSSYRLENLDVLGWSMRLDNTQFDNIPPGENRITKLWVTIENSIPTGTIDEITVTATSIEDNNVIGSAKCFAIAKIRGANVTVSVPAPTERGAKPGENLIFPDIIVTNIDNFADNYILSLTDNAGWAPTISPTTLTLAGGTSENVTLTVLIPDNSFTGMRDSIQITATSLTDNTVSAESSCVAKTTNFFRRVTVSIAPSHQENVPGENLTFTVTVINNGNVRDNFLLNASDNKNWGLSLSAPWVGWIENGTSENVLLRVRIPDNALESTIDNIKVKATSAENENVYSESSCSGTSLKAAGRVEVTISPNERKGAPGEKLSFTVTVKNTGGVDDNYNLIVSDDAGWGATLSASTVTISVGGSHNVIASVTVPTDAVEGESTVITVTAMGTGYENSASCTAIAGAKGGGNLLIILIIAVVAVVIGVGAAIAVLLKKGIIGFHHSASK
jgi:uncharacterized repeat protein (TIGR01451 family)